MESDTESVGVRRVPGRHAECCSYCTAVAEHCESCQAGRTGLGRATWPWYGGWTVLWRLIYIWSAMFYVHEARMENYYSAVFGAVSAPTSRSWHYVPVFIYSFMPGDLRSTTISRKQFRARLKTHLFSQIYATDLWEISFWRKYKLNWI